MGYSYKTLAGSGKYWPDSAKLENFWLPEEKLARFRKIWSETKKKKNWISRKNLERIRKFTHPQNSGQILVNFEVKNYLVVHKKNLPDSENSRRKYNNSFSS